jgi:hypothetical protein
MVCIKHTARPINVSGPSEVESMASDEVLEKSTQHREASMEATSSFNAESNCESRSSGSEHSDTTSDDFGCLKVAVVAAAARITYDFGLSGVTKAHVRSMENYMRYFSEGYGWAPSVESLPEPCVNKAIFFEGSFTARLCVVPHLVLVDILHKFWVQLHQLTSNAIVQIDKFI